MHIIPIENNTGIAIILPSPTFKNWEDFKRSRGYYDGACTGKFHHIDGHRVISFDELHERFIKERQQKEVAI